MTSAGGIRAGAAYVEIGADDGPLQRSLTTSSARLKQWAQDARAQTAAAARQSLGGSFDRSLEHGPSSLGAYLSSNRSHVPAGGAIGYGDFGVNPEALAQAEANRARSMPDLAWGYNRRRGAVMGNIPGMGGGGGGFGGGGGGGGAGDKGFLSGGFRGMELFNTGMKFATAVGAVKIAIKDAQIFSALFQGDMEGARKAAEALPFGLGEIVKELSGPVDSAMNSLVARLTGTWQMKDVYAGKVSNADRQKTVDEYNRGVTAIGAVDKALAKATMSAREFAKYEVDGLKLSADAAAELLAKNLQLMAVEEAKRAAVAVSARAKSEADTVAGARMDLAKATMSEDQYLELEVRMMGLSADRAEELLAYRKETLRVEREKKALADGEEMRADIERAGIEAESALVMKGYDEEAQALANAKRDAAALAEQMQTPEERAKAQVEKYDDMLAYGDITGETRNRAVRKAVEDAAAAMPDTVRQTVGVRGTFNAMEAAGLAGGGIADAMLEAQRQTAKNTEKIAQAAANLGVTFN